MTFVVTEPCIKCKYLDCVEICPVMCFHEGINCVVIDPDECIDCGACVDPCPVEAIYSEREVPEKWREYTLLNKQLARQWPVISTKKDPLPTANEYRNIENKRDQLDKSPGEGDPS
ncbi:MAG: hypothetical protein AMXMBFR82_33850 [Candidatus Hydrogenedentota bacterium]